MAVRILHTSDWHIGLHSGRFSRHADHAQFLAWLCETLAAEQVDALIVAGDIFDGMQPSNESLRLYYRFLRGLERTGVRDIVIIGGNHDSASQLDAPRELLSSLDVHVVGGYSRDMSPASYLVPLRVRGAEEPAFVCIALPYIHEYRLGVRTTDGDAAATRESFADRFKSLYTELADLAGELYPELPLVGTGHLTMGKREKGDSPQEIHQVGFIDSLPSEVLDARLRYVALGHIHRSFPVEKGRVWYSGSPLPVSLPEMKRPRRVLLVDLEDSDAAVSVRPIEVPVARDLLERCGTEEQVVAWLRDLRVTKPLPPLLYLKVAVQEPEPELGRRIRDAIDKLDSENRPLLVELREILVGAEGEQERDDTVVLEDLSPRDVFARLCASRGSAVGSELLQAFDFVATAKPAELEERLRSVSGEERTAEVKDGDAPSPADTGLAVETAS